MEECKLKTKQRLTLVWAPAKHKKYYVPHPRKLKTKAEKVEQQQRYYLENREAILLKHAVYRKANRERIQELARRYYWSHREAELARSRTYYLAKKAEAENGK